MFILQMYVNIKNKVFIMGHGYTNFIIGIFRRTHGNYDQLYIHLRYLEW